MKKFEILTHGSDTAIKATASTKAALLAAALEGMSVVAAPTGVDMQKPVERPFDVSSAGFPSLLVDFLNQARALAEASGESYDAVRFELVTDVHVKGAFLGHPAKKFKKTIKAATYRDMEVKKNEAGEWETVVALDV